MPKFTTISPTHIPGKKEYAWENFRKGNYVAIGWLDYPAIDLTGKSLDEVADLIRNEEYDNESSAISSFNKFISLEVGDYVAVNNANDGLFGVGIISSGYKFDVHKHEIGNDDENQFYPHFRDVEWVNTVYTSRKFLVSEGETSWQPFGTVGIVSPTLPPYIERLLGTAPPPERKHVPLRPAFLESVISAVETLRKEREHKERAHESLVEDFFVALGYRKHNDIKYRHGRVDITIDCNGQPSFIAEVKASWDLSFRNGIEAIKQAYNYAHDQGVRFVVATNGDTYLLFDRLKGLSWESNLLGEFRLTTLVEDDLTLIERMRHDRLGRTDIGEALRYMAESFPDIN